MKGLTFQVAASSVKPRAIQPRRPALAGVGRLRKIALLGGAATIRHAPFRDPSWEIWAHASCRHLCPRDADVLFDLHPPELWRDPKKKTWDPKFLEWAKGNRIPIYMQQAYPDVLSSMKYPFETMITEFPRGYMTNTVTYMIALALMEGVTHLGVFGCEYKADSEYGPQRGGCEYWLGIAEGRGVQVVLPPGCDLLNKPSLLYGYESHPKGVLDPSYKFGINPLKATKARELPGPHTLIPSDHPNAPPLRDIGKAPEPWSTQIAWA